MPLSMTVNNDELAEIYNILNRVKGRHSADFRKWCDFCTNYFSKEYRNRDSHIIVFSDDELDYLKFAVDMFLKLIYSEGGDQNQAKMCESLKHMIPLVRARMAEEPKKTDKNALTKDQISDMLRGHPYRHEDRDDEEEDDNDREERREREAHERRVREERDELERRAAAGQAWDTATTITFATPDAVWDVDEVAF